MWLVDLRKAGRWKTDGCCRLVAVGVAAAEDAYPAGSEKADSDGDGDEYGWCCRNGPGTGTGEEEEEASPGSRREGGVEAPEAFIHFFITPGQGEP